MKKERHYSVYSIKDGMLIASLSWDLVKSIHGPSPEGVRAVYLTTKGKLQVRWICTGLDANAEENREELSRLNIAREKNNRGRILIQTYEPLI